MTRPTRGTAPNWRNRIVGYDQVSVEAIQANPKNHRLHPEAQRRALSGVLDEVGIVQNVIINRTTGRLVDGHLRVALAVRAGEDTLPATIVELSEEEERKILLSLDYLAGYMACAEEVAQAAGRRAGPEAPSMDPTAVRHRIEVARKALASLDRTMASIAGGVADGPAY